MKASNLPAGVTGNEPEIAGYDEFEFVCPTCDLELWFTGTKWDAWARCPECGDVNISPMELWESDDAERLGDYQRDERQ